MNQITKQQIYNAIKQNDVNFLKEFLLDETKTSDVEKILYEMWNEPSSPAEKKNIEKAFALFKNRVQQTKNNNLKRYIFEIAAAAAIIAAFMLLGLNYIKNDKNETGEMAEMTEIYTNYGETKKSTLPDGTKIWINAGSRILYPVAFNGNTRNVYVSGEVYFEVEKDTKHPFIVSLNEMKIKVTGTTFNVKSYIDESDQTVTLVNGSVDISVPSNNDIFHLTPEKTLTYNRFTADIELHNIDKNKNPSWFKGEDNFRNKTLAEIAKELERKFNVKIVIRNKTIAQTKFYAFFVNNESVDEILNAININKLFTIIHKDNIYDIY